MSQRKYDAHIEAIVANQVLFESLCALIEDEVVAARGLIQDAVLAGKFHEAVSLAGRARGLEDFVATMNGVATDYRRAKTSRSQ